MYFLLSGLLLLFPCSLYGQLFVLLIDSQLSKLSIVLLMVYPLFTLLYNGLLFLNQNNST